MDESEAVFAEPEPNHEVLSNPVAVEGFYINENQVSLVNPVANDVQDNHSYDDVVPPHTVAEVNSPAIVENEFTLQMNQSYGRVKVAPRNDNGINKNVLIALAVLINSAGCNVDSCFS